MAQYGTTFLSLNLNLHRSCNILFIIADVKSAIIGADFLVHHALLLDLKCKQLVDTVTQLTSKGQLADANIYNVFAINKASFNNNAYAELLNRFVDITMPHLINHSSKADNAVCHHIETTGAPVFDKLAAAKEDFDILKWCHPSVQQPVGKPYTPGPKEARWLVNNR